MPQNHFIFIANDMVKPSGDTVLAEHIAEKLLQEGFWAVGNNAPNQTRLAQGDRVLIYLAGNKRRHFVASAEVLLGASRIPLDSPKLMTLKALGVGFMHTVIELTNIRWLGQPAELRPLVPQMEFIKEKKNWGLHMRLPIVRITKSDYERVIAPFTDHAE